MSSGWSEDEIPFIVDDVDCDSASTNFLSCSSTAETYSTTCDHSENVFLRCFELGKDV